MGKDLPIKPFPSGAAWKNWLASNHSTSNGIWLKIFKKDSEIKTVTYAEALDEALCHGWIDGQKNAHDKVSWLQKFTPRRPKSLWSKRNREHVARLSKEGRMRPAGILEVEQARKDGRWGRAYDSAKDMNVPPDFLKALRKDPAAYEFFKTLNKANTYAIAWRLQTAKLAETRERRMKKLVTMMQQHKTLH